VIKEHAGEAAGMKELSGYFRALADTTRLKILYLLTEHEMCVCELEDRLSMSQPAVSHHLRALRKTGLISGRKSGKWTYYFINGRKVVENQARFEELALLVIKDRVTRGMPATPVNKEGDSYCKVRGNFSPTRIKV
jgi:DNA-binding transcriptional ArsR family regulator